jgi:molecular chaperone DnaJ
MDIHQAFTELGLTLQASPHEARAAYRTLAMRWHPDVNDGHPTDTRMQRINVAYALVCQYQDASAAATARATSHAKPSGFTQFDWKTGFQCAAANRGAPDPEPHAVTDAPAAERRLGVSLFEAAFGCTKRVSGTEPVSCLRCTGSGAYAGSWTLASQCPGCFGRGQAPALQTGAERTPCADCRGSGVQRPTAPPCPACRGTGKIERQAWQVDVAIHCGTLDGTQVQSADI